MNLDVVHVGNYPWIPILLFFIIISTGAIIGFFMNWKASLYFLTGNLIFAIIGILVYIPIYNAITSNIINDYKNNVGDISAVLTEVRGYWGTIFLLSWLLISNIIIWIVYIFVRKFLKVDIAYTTKKTMGTRISAMSLGIITGTLIAIPAMNTATIIFTPIDVNSKHSKFTMFGSWSLKTMSFGTMYGSQNIQRLVKFLNMVQDKKSSIYVFGSLVSGDFKDHEDAKNKWNAENHDLILIFGDTQLTKALLKSTQQITAEQVIPNKFFDIYYDVLEKGIGGFKPLNLNIEIQNMFRNLLSKIFVVTDNGKHDGTRFPEKEKLVINYLTDHLFGKGVL